MGEPQLPAARLPEPCAFPAKFPDVRVVTTRYLAGETLRPL
jgi:hypothetical protein